MKGKVRLISDGIFGEKGTRHGGWGIYDQGVTVVLETEAGHTIVLTSARMPPFSLQQVLGLGIRPEEKKIIIVKGVIAPRAAYEPIASMIVTVDTPGSTTANPQALEFRHRPRPLYPLETNAEYPAI
jgi:microcystin degradation protein MlrC